VTLWRHVPEAKVKVAGAPRPPNKCGGLGGAGCSPGLCKCAVRDGAAIDTKMRSWRLM
jgi:hypothetical protein